MAKPRISLKQLAIDKDNATILLAAGFASFIIVFSLVASYSLLNQSNYQGKVIGKKKTALKQLKVNSSEVEKLKTSYQVFASAEQNVLGGNSKGTGDKDGENPRLVLDALPSKYDFPALTSSLEKLFKPYALESITGTDDEVAQASATQDSGDIQPVEMPFSISLLGSSQQSKDILQLFERSIRPFQIQKLTFTGKSNQTQLDVTAKTYMQPEKKFEIKTEVVR